MFAFGHTSIFDTESPKTFVVTDHDFVDAVLFWCISAVLFSMHACSDCII